MFADRSLPKFAFVAVFAMARTAFAASPVSEPPRPQPGLPRPIPFGAPLIPALAPPQPTPEAAPPAPDPGATTPEPNPTTYGALERAASAGNRPPVIDGISPARFVSNAEAPLRVGKPLEMTLDVSDPDGDSLTVTAFGVPEGARFDPELRLLRWTPTAAQRAVHTIRFVVSDGDKEVSRIVRVLVTDNRPPVFARNRVELAAKSPADVSLTAIDPDGDSLTYTIQGAPEGATFDGISGQLRWFPSEDDAGPHQMLVTASDGQYRVPQSFTLDVSEGRELSRNQWSSYLLPGVGYSLYAPRNRDTVGTFHGIELELLISAWIHRNENRGPSHGRVYLNAELLNSTDADVPILFTYAFGFSLSLERNPQRTFLIPNYGLDLGRMTHDDLGSRFQATPYAGLHLFSDPNLFLSARLGYRLVPSDMERLAGLHASGSFNFSVW